MQRSVDVQALRGGFLNLIGHGTGEHLGDTPIQFLSLVDASTDAQEPLPPAVDTTVTQRIISVASGCSTQSIKSSFYGLVIGEELQSLSPEQLGGGYLDSTPTAGTNTFS